MSVINLTHVYKSNSTKLYTKVKFKLETETKEVTEIVGAWELPTYPSDKGNPIIPYEEEILTELSSDKTKAIIETFLQDD